MAKNQRNTQGQNVQDPANIHNLEYSNAAGSQKVSEVGRSLLPLQYISGGVVTYTTDASTSRKLDSPGKNLAIYNNSGSVGSVTVSLASRTSLAAGAVDATTGDVGIACQPNAWTYVACSSKSWVITSASTLLTYLIEDETSIKQEVAF